MNGIINSILALDKEKKIRFAKMLKELDDSDIIDEKIAEQTSKFVSIEQQTFNDLQKSQAKQNLDLPCEILTPINFTIDKTQKIECNGLTFYKTDITGNIMGNVKMIRNGAAIYPIYDNTSVSGFGYQYYDSIQQYVGAIPFYKTLLVYGLIGGTTIINVRNGFSYMQPVEQEFPGGFWLEENVTEIYLVNYKQLESKYIGILPNDNLPNNIDRTKLINAPGIQNIGNYPFDYTRTDKWGTAPNTPISYTKDQLDNLSYNLFEGIEKIINERAYNSMYGYLGGSDKKLLFINKIEHHNLGNNATDDIIILTDVINDTSSWKFVKYMINYKTRYIDYQYVSTIEFSYDLLEISTGNS